MRRAASWVLGPVLLLAVGCSRHVSSLATPLRVLELPSPAAAGSGQPNVAVTPDGRFLLSWIEKTGDATHALRYASRRNGEPWSTPVTVAEGTDWFVNWADFPSLAALPDGTLYAHWLAKSGSGTYAYDLRVARSTDGGKTWSDAITPHRDGRPTEHGFASMSPWRRDQMGIVWLDGRKMGGAGHDGHAEAAAEMSLMHTTLDREGRLGEETVLDERVCECCQTDAVVAGDTTVVVYRDRSDTEVRDMSVARYQDGRWSPPRTLASDGWQITGCPVNGPAIAARGGNVGVAWFTAAGEKSLVKAAFSTDSGVTFTRPFVVDDQRPLGRVDVVMLDDETALISWLQEVEGGARVQVRRMARSGKADEPLTVAQSSEARSSGFPRMGRTDDEVVIAWRDGASPSRVRAATLAVASRQ